MFLRRGTKKERWVAHVTHTMEMSNAYKIPFEKGEGKRSFERTASGWEENV
jgi:hypothetical protein